MKKQSKKNNSKNKIVKQNNNKRRRKTTRRNRQPTIAMSKCAMHYALAISNPFDIRARGACVPTFPARPTYKVSNRLIVEMVVGDGGFGFCAVSPCVVNDKLAIVASKALFPDTKIIFNDANTINATMSNLPYTAEQAWNTANIQNASVSGRIVSVGMKATYTGTELSRGGMMAALTTSDHRNLNQMSWVDITSYTDCVRVPVTRKSFELVASAVDPNECDFAEAAEVNTYVNEESSAKIQCFYPYSQGQRAVENWPDIGAPIMAIVATGSPGNTFQIEIIQLVEYIGRPTNSYNTPSHSDIDGLSKVLNAAGKTPGTRASNPNLSQAQAFTSNLYQTIVDNQDIIVPVVNAAVNMLANSPSLRGRIGN